MTSGSLKRMIREELSRRSLPKGGITDLPGQEFRTDATAWGILALGVARGFPNPPLLHRRQEFPKQWHPFEIPAQAGL